MGLRSLAATCLICWSAIAAGQISGEFYLEKSTYAQGEPVFLYFQVVNNGSKPESVEAVDPYCSFSGPYVSVSSDLRGASCSRGVGGSCLSGQAKLLPGQKRVEHLLLNFDHEIWAPGEYSAEAVRFLPHASADVKVRTTLHFRVDEAATQDPKTFQPLVDQLRSTDPITRVEAARTLASMAPKSLEDTLLAFADSDDPLIRQFAPLAFYRLNTPRSMSAMADLLRKSQPAGKYERIKSADYLAQSGDPQWFPLLLEAAKANPEIGSYPDDAARLGGEKMVATLVQIANRPDNSFTLFTGAAQANAALAMGSTGSRAAVPVLLNLLRNPNNFIAYGAMRALQQLTRRTVVNDQKSEGPQSQYLKWSQWWEREGATAPIYKATECGDLTPLQ
jgi:hypothetical protein